VEAKRKTVLITGATSGLGREVAFALAEAGLHVVVHGRDRDRVESLAERLREGHGGAEPEVADLSSLAETRDLARRVAVAHPRLDILINNAGIGAGPPPHTAREISVDGNELRFAVNYLAPVLLARSLVPALAAAGSARVVNVGSVGQAPVDVEDLRLESGYGGAEAYFRSKCALAAFTVDLAERLRGSGVSVNCVHPATFMDTAQVREAGVSPWVPASAGVPAVLALATGEAGAKHTGTFFDGTRPARADPSVYDPEARARLRLATDRLLAAFDPTASAG
jgi:NAD(P)-dependent dehydrogenase (short-subunit alcohol dehydrogenase family)